MANRGLSGAKKREEFLNPPSATKILDTLPENLAQSVQKGKEKILSTIKSGVPMIIHGDYDADGICATAILYNVLKKELGYDKCFAFIPNRFEHSYGLSESSIGTVSEKLKKRTGGFEKALLLTVDCGITADAVVKYAKEKGFEVMIVDHHQKPKKLPKADSIIWWDEVVGSALAWILGRALGSKDKQSLALAAIATVTDLQPVLGINRSIVKEGLEIINVNPPLGIKKLLKLAGRAGKDVTTYDLGWVIGPRLNATGRMDDAGDSLLLLIDRNDDVVEKTAEKLNNTNLLRQDKTLEMYEMAEGLDFEKLPKIIITQNEGYHEGIIGLVASKLVQQYYRPAIVISLGKEYGKGSARSVSGVDIISLLRNFEDVFESLGGHPMAAGFTIQKEKIDLLKDKIFEVSEEIEDELLQPVLEIDAQISLDLVDLDLANEMAKLKPFGMGNPEPLFLSKGVGIASIKTVGRDGRHSSFRFYHNGRSFRGIYFGGAEKELSYKEGDIADIVYSVRESSFNSKEYLDLVIRDMRLSE